MVSERMEGDQLSPTEFKGGGGGISCPPRRRGGGGESAVANGVWGGGVEN